MIERSSEWSSHGENSRRPWLHFLCLDAAERSCRCRSDQRLRVAHYKIWTPLAPSSLSSSEEQVGRQLVEEEEVEEQVQEQEVAAVARLDRLSFDLSPPMSPRMSRTRCLKSVDHWVQALLRCRQ